MKREKHNKEFNMQEEEAVQSLLHSIMKQENEPFSRPGEIGNKGRGIQLIQLRPIKKSDYNNLSGYKT